MAAAEQSEAVADLYNKGLEFMKDGAYKTAAKEFGEVERQHPYSKLATKAILMQAYAQYQRNAYDEAINAAQRFITLHPGHRDAPYAYYLIALSYYEQIGDVKRDQTATKKALQSLEEVSRRYPDTPYGAGCRREGRAGPRPSGRQGNGSRPLLSQARLLSRGRQPLQDGGHRLSDDDRKRRKRSTD